MTLKYSVDELPADMEEAVKGLYKEDNGRFILNVEGVVAKSKLDEFRANNLGLIKERDALAAELKQRGATEAEMAEAVRKHQAEADAARNQEREANKRLREVVFRNQVTATALAAGALPSAIDDIVYRANSALDIDDDGRLIGRDGASADAKAWVSELKSSAGHLFATSNGGGAGGNMRTNEPPKRIKTRADLGDAAAKAAFIKQFGSERYLSLPPAPGVDAPGTTRVRKESDIRREANRAYAEKHGLQT